MKNRNNAPLWFKWAHKIGTAPLKTKLTVGAIGFAFAAAARLAYLQDTATDPKPPAQPVLTPAAEAAAVTLEDNTRLLAAYAAIGMDPPPEIMHQSEQLLETARAPRP